MSEFASIVERIERGEVRSEICDNVIDRFIMLMIYDCLPLQEYSLIHPLLSIYPVRMTSLLYVALFSFIYNILRLFSI